MSRLTLGASAPTFELPGTDGKVHRLSDFASGPFVVIFSCNHCPYAQAWEGRLIELQRAFVARGVRFVVVNANDAAEYPDDSFPRMRERAQEKGYNFPYLCDETQWVARAYGAQRTPEVFLFDLGGRLRYHGAVDDNYDDPGAVKQPYLSAAIEAVLAGEEPPVAETRAVGCTIKWK
ncbi:MAG: thioredoxin family protein [Armatimonadetes bacterium]|nr:thioredoxin family protein [Armatimonadota bacterium]